MFGGIFVKFLLGDQTMLVIILIIIYIVRCFVYVFFFFFNLKSDYVVTIICLTEHNYL